MNRLARMMMRLYPAQWRARYGEELDALISDTNADARTVADLAKGGIRMQFSRWSFLKLAVTLGVAGLIGGAGLALLLPSVYVSKATMQITPTQVSSDMTPSTISNPLNERILEIETNVLSRTELSRIIRKLNLYPDRVNQPFDDTIELAKQNINISFVAAPPAILHGASAFDIEFSYPDRIKAQQMVMALVTAFNEVNQAFSAETANLPDRGVSSLRVMDVASLPEAPIYPSRTAILLTGFLTGVLIASLWRMIQRRGFIARRFALVALAFGIIGLVAVASADRLDILPYLYRSRATLSLRNGTGDQLLAMEERVLSRSSLSAIINDPRLRLYGADLRTMPFDDVVQQMRRHTTISLFGSHDGPVFTVSFDYPDRYKARMVVETLMAQFDWASKDMFPVSARSLAPPPAILDVLDTASLPSTPSKPKRMVIALMGCFWGIVIAGLISIVRRLRTPPAIAPLGAVNG